jgi:DNA helicase-2/ATP-dependent DNA helicase PcrA
MTDAEEGRFVAGTIFEQKMQNQMNNGDFAILYRTNNLVRWKMRLENEIFPTAFMVDCLFYQRKERCIVLFTISYQSKG